MIITLLRHQIMSANDRSHWGPAARQTRFLRTIGGRAWRDSGLAPMARAHLTVTVTWPDRRRRDVANLSPTIKALIDGMVAAGCLPDDNDQHLTGPDLRVCPEVTPDGTYRLTLDWDDMTDATSVLWRIVALSDHHPAGTCWAWMESAEKVCGRPEDPATPHVCSRHAGVARRRAEKEHAKRVAQDARIRAQVEAEAPARAAKLDARIARLTGGGSTDPAVVNLPLAKRIPSDARIAEIARLLRLRDTL